MESIWSVLGNFQNKRDNVTAAVVRLKPAEIWTFSTRIIKYAINFQLRLLLANKNGRVENHFSIADFKSAPLKTRPCVFHVHRIRRQRTSTFIAPYAAAARPVSDIVFSGQFAACKEGRRHPSTPARFRGDRSTACYREKIPTFTV